MYTVEQMRDELDAMLEAGTTESDDHLMLDVAGRWTGIKGLSVEDGNLVLIESED